MALCSQSNFVSSFAVVRRSLLALLLYGELIDPAKTWQRLHGKYMGSERYVCLVEDEKESRCFLPFSHLLVLLLDGIRPVEFFLGCLQLIPQSREFVVYCCDAHVPLFQI